MAIDFPNNPNTGDVHSDGGANWRWSGYAWRRIPDPGAKGEPGSKGDKGQKGEVGPTGSQGDKGQKGEASTVAGPKGDTGDKGATGTTGSDGDKGEKGEPSTVAGDKGEKGDKGGTGAGTKGEKGAGSSVTIGTSPPTSPTPVAGDMWWDSDDADLHVYYSDGSSAQWVSVTSSAALKGQTGDKGQKGEKGEKGQKGEIGEKGTKGEIGATGGTGGTGQKGQKGQDGNDATGTKGQKGEKGEIGPQGGSGGTGAKGEPGASGSSGSDGDKGQKGEAGSSGTDAQLPVGTVVAYGGNSAPSGWQLCNGGTASTSALQTVLGQSNVPDLRDRFVVGAGNSYSRHNTGGSASVTLTAAQMPNHAHFFSTTTGGGDHVHQYIDQYVVINNGYRPWPASNNDCAQRNINTTGSGAHSHLVTGTTNQEGGGASHENRPPYYALIYIIKT